MQIIITTTIFQDDLEVEEEDVFGSISDNVSDNVSENVSDNNSDHDPFDPPLVSISSCESTDPCSGSISGITFETTYFYHSC